MKYTNNFFKLFTFLTIFGATMAYCNDDAVKEILNKESLNKILSESKKTIVLDFTASWCGPCKMVKPILEKFAKSSQETHECYTIDIDKNQDIAKEYNISVVPTFVVIKDKQQHSFSGAFSNEEDLKSKILNEKIDLSKLSKEELTAKFQSALQNLSVEEVKELIKFNVDVNITFSFGLTPIQFVSVMTDASNLSKVQEIIKELINSGANLEITNPQIIKELINSGANLEVTNPLNPSKTFHVTDLIQSNINVFQNKVQALESLNSYIVDLTKNNLTNKK